MEIGEEWIYRRKAFSPSERVRILAIEKRKQTTTRVDIAFLDDERVGLHDNVPASRLHGPLSIVKDFDTRMANWHRLSTGGIDETEESAVGDVFDLLIPESVATYYDSSVRNGATVRDRQALERLMRRPIDARSRTQVEWFDHDEVLELSAEGTLLIAQFVCAADPAPILAQVMAEEAEVRGHCKRGRDYDAIDGSGKKTSSPEREYEWYRTRQRPVHELLRGWCGHHSVTFVERLTAAEAEVRRLDILVASLVDALSKHDALGADIYERDHNENRVSPETIRPVIGIFQGG